MDTVAFSEIRTPEECRTVLQQKFAVIFKHSEVCDISQGAYATVSEFCAARADFPVHLVSVLQSREASRFVEEKTGVVHESPQVISIRNGQVIAHASHEEITTDFLESLV